MSFEIDYPKYFETLGIEIIDFANGIARLKMSFDEKITQPFGMVHGGAIFSLADSSCALSVLSILKEKKQFVTAEMKINYLEPVSKGDIYSISKVLRQGRVMPVEAEIINNDKLVAKALGTYIILDQN